MDAYNRMFQLVPRMFDRDAIPITVDLVLRIVGHEIDELDQRLGTIGAAAGCHACADEVGLSHMASSAGLCRGHAVDLENRLAEALAAVPEWVDVAGWLPEFEQAVLVIRESGGARVTSLAMYRSEVGEWYDIAVRGVVDNVTHWRRFPSLPKHD